MRDILARQIRNAVLNIYDQYGNPDTDLLESRLSKWTGKEVKIYKDGDFVGVQIEGQTVSVRVKGDSSKPMWKIDDSEEEAPA